MVIKINVSGIQGVQAMLNNIVNNPTASKELLTEVSGLLVSRAKENAHMITGHMKDSISARVEDKKAVVTAAANYSAYENRRSGVKGGLGPHNFMDRAVESVKADLSGIVKRHSSKWSGGKSKCMTY